jgi:hypothetical protein
LNSCIEQIVEKKATALFALCLPRQETRTTNTIP